MHITIIMIVTFSVCCLRVGTFPWKFFQVNARYFSADEGIFSKLSLDKLIPKRWRLYQMPDSESVNPEHYPVFLKPEWGQNAHGIHRADTESELQHLRTVLSQGDQRYILQEAATGTREFEIFSIDSDQHDGKHDVLTVTEAVNCTERFPINSKYNSNTRYVDLTAEFNQDELYQLSAYINEIGRFGITRISVRADSRGQLLAGYFRVIEINLFLPMPINLLDESYTWAQRLQFIGHSMMYLAHATKAIKPIDKPQAIFTRMMLYGRSSRWPERIRQFDMRRTIL